MASASKAIELQLQVKQNAEELQDFMRDLENWEILLKKIFRMGKRKTKEWRIQIKSIKMQGNQQDI